MAKFSKIVCMLAAVMATKETKSDNILAEATDMVKTPVLNKEQEDGVARVHEKLQSVNETQKKLRHAQDNLDASQREAGAKEQVVEEYKKKILQAKEEAAYAKGQQKELRIQNDKLKSDIEELQAEKDRLRVQVETATGKTDMKKHFLKRERAAHQETAEKLHAAVAFAVLFGLLFVMVAALLVFVSVRFWSYRKAAELKENMRKEAHIVAKLNDAAIVVDDGAQEEESASLMGRSTVQLINEDDRKCSEYLASGL